VEASSRNATFIPAVQRPRPTGRDTEVLGTDMSPLCKKLLAALSRGELRFLSRRRTKLTILLSVAVVFSVTANSTSSDAAPSVQRGKAFAQANCSHCHSIDKFTQSPLAIAPPFRTLHQRYKVESLEEALGEGIVTGHPSMPEFRLDPGQVSDFISFLKSL